MYFHFLYIITINGYYYFVNDYFLTYAIMFIRLIVSQSLNYDTKFQLAFLHLLIEFVYNGIVSIYLHINRVIYIFNNFIA